MKKQAPARPHYWGHRERLTKRFLHGGTKGLQEYELLELLLTYSIARKDTKPVGKALLNRFGDLPGVLDADVHQLSEIDGVGQRSAVLIKLARQLLESYLKRSTVERRKLSSPRAVVDYCRLSMGGLRDEQFRALYLNAQNELVAEEILQEGTVNQAVVYPRKVLEHALRHKASCILLIHNHPGGLLKPSRSDIDLTKKIRRTAEDMGITVHDHFIITREGYYSFHENDLL